MRRYFIRKRLSKSKKPIKRDVPFGATFQTQWTGDDVFQVCGAPVDYETPACPCCDFHKHKRACAFFKCNPDERRDGRDVCAIKIPRNDKGKQ